ncbi:MAG: NUDIX hydrolase [Actinomycetes bacterium]
MSLNPALEEVSHCPRCGGPAEVAFPHRLTCPGCGYGAYYNPKPVAAALTETRDGRIILLRRGFEPGKGLWTIPGGFVDLGESVEDAARREAMEELRIEIELTGLIGVYSKPDDRVVLIVHSAVTDDEPRLTEEATEIAIVAPDAIPWSELAFWSTEQALRDHLATS